VASAAGFSFQKGFHMDNSYYAANPGYQGLAGAISSTPVNKPREIGICDRVQGLNSGLTELNGRLCSFLSRLNGVPMPAMNGAQPLPAGGLTGSLSEAEALLRECFNVISALDEKF
jgi:hypothetical protein